jgi:hypothetical protein
MGTLGDGNGGNRPPDNGGQPNGVPDLPPEWGVIVIPDDPAELAEEAASLRREMRKTARRDRWRRRLHLPPRPAGSSDDSSALGIPLLIMSIAVLATLTSLFAVAWPGQPRQPALRPSAQTVATPPIGSPTMVSIADITLADPAGESVHLRELLPAVVVLIDGCRCESLLAGIAAAAGPDVTVVAVAPTLPAGTAVPTGPRMRLLIDRDTGLRAAMSGLSRGPGRAAVLLVAFDGSLIKALPAVGSVDDFRADLSRLHR